MPKYTKTRNELGLSGTCGKRGAKRYSMSMFCAQRAEKIGVQRLRVWGVDKQDAESARRLTEDRYPQDRVTISFLVNTHGAASGWKLETGTVEAYVED